MGVSEILLIFILFSYYFFDIIILYRLYFFSLLEMFCGMFFELHFTYYRYYNVHDILYPHTDTQYHAQPPRT